MPKSCPLLSLPVNTWQLRIDGPTAAAKKYLGRDAPCSPESEDPHLQKASAALVQMWSLYWEAKMTPIWTCCCHCQEVRTTSPMMQTCHQKECTASVLVCHP